MLLHCYWCCCDLHCVTANDEFWVRSRSFTMNVIVLQNLYFFCRYIILLYFWPGFLILPSTISAICQIYSISLEQNLNPLLRTQIGSLRGIVNLSQITLFLYLNLSLVQSKGRISKTKNEHNWSFSWRKGWRPWSATLLKTGYGPSRKSHKLIHKLCTL